MPSVLHNLFRPESLGSHTAQGLQCAQGHPKGSGRAYPYPAAAHSWPPPSSRAVCSAIISLDCMAAWSCLLHLSLSLGATPECPLSNSVPKSKATEHLLPPLHIPTCVQRADLFNWVTHNRHGLGRDYRARRSLHQNWPASLCSHPPPWVPAQRMPSIPTPL